MFFKILAGFAWKKEEMEVNIAGRSSSRKNGANSYGWEQRKAPSGPDPLHHNGGGPKKPQTP